MNIAIRIILNVMAIICVSGCGTSVSTGPAPTGGYDYRPVKYETNAVNTPSVEVGVEDSTIVADAQAVSLKVPVKCKPGETLSFRGKVVGLTETNAPQVIAVICTQQLPWGSGVTANGAISCKLDKDGSVYYSVDLQSPTLAGKHKLEIKAYRMLNADGTIAAQDNATISILAKGIVEVAGVAPDLPTVAPDPDPAFSRGTTNPMK